MKKREGILPPVRSTFIFNHHPTYNGPRGTVTRRRRAKPQCGGCGVIGHRRNNCPEEIKP